MVTIELFGLPRLRAGRDVISVEAASLGQALRALGTVCPALSPSIVDGDRLKPAYLVALNGTQFTADPATPLANGDVVVLLSADAGG